MFADGLTTRSEVSEFSGRGVGLAAFRAACSALGGAIAITSEHDVGTIMTITWPAAFATAHVYRLAG
jgi:two-component system chemotaxis sensor kinase CheA